jgi:uncharacterized membrane protein YbhN (UPF0104 family)
MQAGAGLAPPAERPIDRRAALRRGLVIGAVFLVLFGIILPRFVDYGEVIEALRSLSPIELGLLLGLGVLGWLLEGVAYSLPLPGLPVTRAVATFLGSTAISNTIPGPVDMGVRYGLYRGWGFSVEAATSGIFLAGVFDQLGKFAVPIIALAFVLLEGRPSGLLGIAAGGSLVVLVVIGAAGFVVIRSERVARALGRLLGRGEALVSRLLKRPAGTMDPEARVLSIREATRGVVQRRGLAGLLVATLGKLAWYACLLAALRFAGASPEALPASVILGVYAIVLIASVVPIAPGGAGVAEVIYLTLLGGYVGPGTERAAVTAGVLLFRVIQWVLPIPLGYLLLPRLRRARRVTGHLEPVEQARVP